MEDSPFGDFESRDVDPSNQKNVFFCTIAQFWQNLIIRGVADKSETLKFDILLHFLMNPYPKDPDSNISFERKKILKYLFKTSIFYDYTQG